MMNLILTPINSQKINQLPNLTNEYHAYIQDELVAIIYSENSNPSSYLIYDPSFIHGEVKGLNPILGSLISDILKNIKKEELKITVV